MAQAVSVGDRIQTWSIGRREISLSKDPVRENCFVYADTRNQKTGSFEVNRFSSELAIQIIHIFHEVIAKRLEKETIDSSTFLPICYERVHHVRNGRFEPLPEFRFALFGTYDLITEKVQDAFWAVCREANGAVIYDKPARVSPMLENFICHAPRYNRPNADMKRNFELDSYLRNFVVAINASQQQAWQSIALYRCSALDKTVLLDNDQWAVTLLSTKRASGRSFFSDIIDKDVGHAVIVCESYNEGEYSREYIHLIDRPARPNLHLQKGEGNIQIIQDKDFPMLDRTPMEHGPTWSRPRHYIENMLQEAHAMEGEPVKFALYGGIFQLAQRIWAIRSQQTQQAVRGERASEVDWRRYTVNRREIPQTCLDWAITLLKCSGIYLFCTQYLRTPLDKIKILGDAPVYEIPQDVDKSYLDRGEPFPERYSDIVRGILCSCVVLAPPNIRKPDLESTLELWEIQHTVEGIERSNQRMRMQNEGSGLIAAWERYPAVPKW